MQSEVAAPLRGWRVSALTFLKGLGNQMGRPTHAPHTHTHPDPRSSSCPDTPCLGFRIRRTEKPSAGAPGGASQVLSRPPLVLFSSLSPHMVTPAFPTLGPRTPTPHQIPLSPGSSLHLAPQIDRPTLLPPQYPLSTPHSKDISYSRRKLFPPFPTR